MHMHCQDWSGCACPDCHFTCQRCQGNCRNIYDLVTGLKVCATCYKSALRSELPVRVGCEGCGAPYGYRNLSDPRERYLCHACHVEDGTEARWPEWLTL